MAATKILIIGESGTGKSTSIRNCNPDITAIVNPVGKPLPFKGSKKYDTLNSETDCDTITAWIKKEVNNGKKTIIVDDFQYILAIPFMDRIKETGWDKYNDFGYNYFSIIDVCKELPDDVTVYYLSHLETLDNGLTTVKLIGKLLREKITIEGLFTIVLRTGVNEGKYYFFTQNSGKDTVKSPMGMFDAYAIENDLAYVDAKIRNYYEYDGAISDEEMAKADEAKAANIEKPEGRRKSRSEKRREEAQAAMEKHYEKIEEIANGREEIPDDEVPPFEDADKATQLEKDDKDDIDKKIKESSEVVLEKDTYFHVKSENNYIIKRAGDKVNMDDLEEITAAEYIAGAKELSNATFKRRTRKERK